MRSFSLPFPRPLCLFPHAFFFSLLRYFFYRQRRKKADVPREFRWLRSHLIIEIDDFLWRRRRRRRINRTFFAPNVHVSYSYGSFLFYLDRGESSKEDFYRGANRRWPIFISAISALWVTRGERCVMLVKCDLLLFVCVCISFFERRKEERKLGEFSMIEEFVLQQTFGKL